ncbi:MAG TPA: sodium:solute symporter [Clostridia bacterium]|nr:sodium:solute symporter [Clostridia bacterium]
MKLLLLTFFVAGLIVIGVISRKKSKTTSDFILGGRNIGPWMSAFAYGTTYFSAVLFIGYAGETGWNFGLSGLWIAIGNSLLGCFLAWKVLGRRTKEMTTRLNVMTMPDFLSVRYDSPGLKFLSALVIFIFLVPYSASVYMGLSYLFEEIFHIPYNFVLLLMACLTAFYLIAGGYFAVALTDLFQGLLMIFGIVFMVFYVSRAPQVGGIGSVIERLEAINPKLTAVVGPPGWKPLFFLVMLTSLGGWGLPQMVQKFYTIRDEKSIKAATTISTLFALIISLSAYYVGALTRLFFDTLPVLNGQPNPDMLIPQIIGQTLPDFAAALVLILVLSASMSTLASLVLISSSTFVMDILGSGFKLPIVKNKPTFMLRLFCLIFIALSLVVAYKKPSIILNLMALSWGTVAGTFLASYLYGLYWKGTTKAGAWAGALSGLAISLGLSIYFKLSSNYTTMIGTIAMVAPLLIVPLVSLVTKSLPESHLNIIFPSKLEEKIHYTLGKTKEVLNNDLG